MRKSTNKHCYSFCWRQFLKEKYVLFYYVFYLKKDMIDIIKIIKSVKDSGVLIDGVVERVKHEIKNRRWILRSFNLSNQ